ncbi:MAG: hypothetical protein FIA89_13795 [Geobacter sp.]|jgi:predicted regulator of Ras-like GTPase activity (Roadblock/LC7/MglB family)|nr:hypothetical protein [Geobacter sp.]
MPFQTILKELVDVVPRAIGAIVVDWEGEAVQEYCHCDSYDIRFMAAHKGIILARLRETHVDNLGGEIEEVMVISQHQVLLIGAVDADYSLVLQVERPCVTAVARRHFAAAVARLKKEL